MWCSMAILAVFLATSADSANTKQPSLSNLIEEVDILIGKYSLIQENYEQIRIQNEDIKTEMKVIQEKSAKQETQIASLRRELELISSGSNLKMQPPIVSHEDGHSINNNTVEERLDHLEELAKIKVLRTCAELQDYGVSSSGSYFIDPDGENIGHAPIRVHCDFEQGTTEVLHSDDNQLITIPHCGEELCYTKEFIYTAPMDQIISLIHLSSSCSQDINFDCYLAPLLTNDVEIGTWTDRHGEDQIYFDGAHYGEHTCSCAFQNNNTCSGHEIFHTKCNCDNTGAFDWLQDYGKITNSTALPISAFKYGPLLYDAQEAKVKVGRLKCSGKANIKTSPSSCNDLKKLGETRSGLYPLQDSSNDNYAKVSFCDMSVPGYEGDIETMEGWLKFSSGPGDVLFAVQHHGHDDITIGSIVTYDTAVVNHGNSMNLGTGVFTADIPGIYQFTFSGMLMAKSGKIDRVDVMVNGVQHVQIWGIGGHYQDNIHETVSKTFVLNLEKGSTVHLVLTEGALYGEAYWSEFMGKIL